MGEEGYIVRYHTTPLSRDDYLAQTGRTFELVEELSGQLDATRSTAAALLLQLRDDSEDARSDHWLDLLSVYAELRDQLGLIVQEQTVAALSVFGVSQRETARAARVAPQTVRRWLEAAEEGEAE